MGDSFLNNVFTARLLILEWGLFLVCLFFVPAVSAFSRRSIAPTRYMWVGIVIIPMFLAWFIFYFGNRQFGGWDFSILIDTGWRQILGQRPYTNFITPNPPGFNLGVFYAFRIFGVMWNAQIYAAIFFCVASFLWMYWLLRKLSSSPLIALFLAFAVECVTFVPLCFWWYNDVTSVLASVFLLSSIVYAHRDGRGDTISYRQAVWWSYVLSLALLCLMKPNIAGLLIVFATVLLFFAVRSKVQMMVGTAIGGVLFLAILWLNHISLPDMIASYRAAAIERGGLKDFGLYTYTHLQRVLLLLWTLVFAIPLVTLLPRLLSAWRQKRWHDFAFLLLLLSALPVTFYGMWTNGEIKDSETSVLIVSCGILCLVLRQTNLWIRTLFVAIIISMLGGDIYYGVARERVRGIGPGQFYEATGADRPIRDEFFSSLVSTPYFEDVQREVRKASTLFPGPVFLGPRLEFEYAVLRIPSPAGWPVYYQPGTSFASRDLLRVDGIWKATGFQTLIFLGKDRTFYPPDLLEFIESNYERQPGFSDVEVYRRRHQTS